MKKISLLSLLLISSAPIHAMQEVVEEPISPEFNYFDKVKVVSASAYDDLGGMAIQSVQARHIPSMRIYIAQLENNMLGAFTDGYSFQESLEEKSIKRVLDNQTAATIYKILSQADKANPSGKKMLLDELHKVVKKADSEAKAWAFVAGMCN